MNFALMTTVLAAGIISAELFDVFFTVCFLVVFLAECVVKYCIRKKLDLNFTAAVIMLCLGIFAFHAAMDGNELYDFENHYSTLTGRIASVPYKQNDNYKYVLDTKYISVDKYREELSEKILLTTPDEYDFNDTIEVRGILKHTDEAMNESGFDPSVYYKEKDIEYKIFSKETSRSDLKIDKGFTFFTGIKAKISKLINNNFSGDNAGIINAVITGSRHGISDELSNALSKSGVGRFLYSAYFFIMIAMLSVGLLEKKISVNARNGILIIILVLIALFNSDKPVFIKSSLYVGAVLLYRRKKGFIYRPDILSVVAGAMLLSNPLLIYNGSFAVSISASIVLVLFGEALRNKLRFIKSCFVRNSLTAGILCTVSLLPLSAIYFEVMSPYTIILIFLFIPINIMIWVSVFPAMLMLNLFGAAPVFSQILSFALFVYKRLPYFIMKLPYSYIYLASPDVFVLIIAALVLFAIYLKIRKRSLKNVLIAIVSCSLIFVSLQVTRLSTVEFTFVNVGQGDGAVVSVPYKGCILIDGGGGNSYSDYNAGESNFVPYLVKHGKTDIDAAFISHFHADHADGIIVAVKELDVHTLFLPDSMADSELRKEAENAAEQNGTIIKYISDDISIQFDSGIVAEVTVPDERTKMSEDENDTSLLINVKYGDVNCLFTGDMSKFSENSLILKNRVPQAEILKVAHHGSATATGREWVKLVNPQISVISLGKDNIYGFPKQVVLDALEESTIYRTDERGDITIVANKNRIKNIKTYK